MSPVLGREALVAMKRTEIQKLCKDYGVKANLKTEALIDLLLDASRPQAPRHNPPRAPQRPPSSRIPSLAGARPRGQSTGSIIVHDSEDEAERIPQRHHDAKFHEAVPQRTRKAKQTQYKLGVGRPVIAGGSGARTITKSTDLSRTSKRARSSKSIKPSEVAITEGQEEDCVRKPSAETLPEPEVEVPVAAHSRNAELSRDLSQLDMHLVAGPSSKGLDALIAEALAPVQQELDSHKAQLTELNEKVSSLIESFDTQLRNLKSEIQDLARARNSPFIDASIATVREHSVRLPEPPSTPKRVRTPHLPFTLPHTEGSRPLELLNEPSNSTISVPSESQSASEAAQPRQTGSLLPGFPHSILGKRPRESISSHSGALEAVQEDMEPESIISRPAHKRVKLHGSEDQSGEESSDRETRQAEPSDPSPSSRRVGGPSFHVFSEPGEDSLPPMERPSNFYGPASPLMSGPATSSANNAENQNPFNFAFVPIAATPAQAVYPLTMGTFPHPEPPTSPSPAANPDRPGSRHSDRLGAFGAPRSSSRTSGRAASGGSLTRGETGGSGGLQRAPSSNEVASGLGLTAIKTSATEQGMPAPPAKRTMYGTELDGDSRFGDFGVEGVASGFWAGGRF